MIETHCWHRTLVIKLRGIKWEVCVHEEEASQAVQLIFKSKIHYPSKRLAIKAGMEFVRRRQAFNTLNAFLYDLYCSQKLSQQEFCNLNHCLHQFQSKSFVLLSYL